MGEDVFVVDMASGEDKQAELEDESVVFYASAAWEHFGCCVSDGDGSKMVVVKLTYCKQCQTSLNKSSDFSGIWRL